MSEQPMVECLCPTYGRFSRLRESLACFLAQDYPNKQLIILNDADVPIDSEAPNVHVLNLRAFANLGAKRQTLLEGAIPFCNHKMSYHRGKTDVGFADEWIEDDLPPYCAHWDDDDLYLPWHLSSCVEALFAGVAQAPSPVACVQPHGAWYMPDGEVHGIHHNVFEGQMVFHRQAALDLGGYPAKHSGQAKELLGKFRAAGQFKQFEPWPGPSYVYRWDHDLGHISAIGNRDEALDRFQQQNQDFGDGQPLTPADLVDVGRPLLKSALRWLSPDDYAAFESRLVADDPGLFLRVLRALRGEE